MAKLGVTGITLIFWFLLFLAGRWSWLEQKIQGNRSWGNTGGCRGEGGWSVGMSRSLERPKRPCGAAEQIN